MWKKILKEKEVILFCRHQTYKKIRVMEYSYGPETGMCMVRTGYVCKQAFYLVFFNVD